MGEIVNLGRVRKQRARAAAGDTAQAMRARHGQTKTERLRQQKDAARGNALLDGALLDGVLPNGALPNGTRIEGKRREPE
ncbi:MAG: DUF4169 family protein [Acidisphaera sp.]|nr:DUF4169 family protein [Acidisphaera sp.]